MKKPRIECSNVLKALESVGWYPERNIDTNRQAEYFVRNGWKIFDAAQEFWALFDELPVLKYPVIRHSILFSSIRADDSREWVANFEKEQNVLLLPVGIYDQLLTIYISDQGRLMFSDMKTSMFLFDLNIDQALTKMFFESSEELEKLPLNPEEFS